MAYLKYVIVFVALFACVWAVSTTWGSRNASDILLFNKSVVLAKVANAYQQTELAFPTSGQSNTRVITCINVTDHFTNNSGATNNLWSGGVGYRFATINLKSQYGQGINSTVIIYGK